MSKESSFFEAAPELFPYVFKDIESGIYVSESKVPTSRSIGKIQLVVDNNVLGSLRGSPNLFKRLAWMLGQNSTSIGSEVSINPYFAIAEQFLSNPDNAKVKIEAFATHPGTLNCFPENYAAFILESVRDNDASLRAQLGQFVCYFFVLKELYFSKLTLEKRVGKWLDFFKNDIPKLMIPFILGQLFFFGKDDPSMRFKYTDRKVQSWAQGFLDVRAKEQNDPARWIRNRLFDILPFQMLPTLNWAAVGGIDGRLFLLSQDQDVGECFLRIFSWSGEQEPNSLWSLMANFSCLEFPAKAAFEQATFGKLESRQVTNPVEKIERMRRLIDSSIALLSPMSQSDLFTVLNEFRFFEFLMPENAKEQDNNGPAA